MFFQLPGWWGVVAILTVVPVMWYGKMFLMPFMAVSSLIIGVSYGSVHILARTSYQQLVGKVVTLEGHVREDPSKNATGKTSLQLDTIYITSHSYPGTVLVSLRHASDIKRGDSVQVTGLLKESFGSFAATMSVLSADTVVRSTTRDVGRVVRDFFADEVRSVIGDPQASLGIGFLTGQKTALPEDLSESLTIAGLTHIVVASGYNLTILVRASRSLFMRISKYTAAMASFFLIAGFIAITGLSPSMTRAGLVSVLSLASWYYGHRFHAFVLLPLVTAVSVAWQPSYVWGDLGWQLSFAAFFGVLVVAPLLQSYFFGKKEPGMLRQILGETIAAHLVTMPIIALSFGVVSHVAIIANLLVVPLVPLAMLLTFICGLLAIANVPGIWLVSIPIEWLLTYMTTVAEYVSNLSWAQSEVGLPPFVWLGYAAMLVLVCVWMARATRKDFRVKEPLM